MLALVVDGCLPVAHTAAGSAYFWSLQALGTAVGPAAAAGHRTVTFALQQSLPTEIGVDRARAAIDNRLR